MAARERLICAAEAVRDGGEGVRFEVDAADGPVAAFVVRHGGRVYAYLNRCAHVPVELDWVAGQFFDLTGQWLMCAVHGAHYDPRDGRCVLGPCKGRRLHAVPVRERAGGIYLVAEVGDGEE